MDSEAERIVQGSDRLHPNEQMQRQRLIPANPEGTCWTGKCWSVHNLLKYEFDLQFDIPVTYPATAPELELPQLDGKTQKMYRGVLGLV
ncbi:ubiquitin-fold modifier-conjugating enzyme 1-like isoform X2 [Durio zibethinus]|uniref:Ubiquitin-fold modifier-conjugating enzyme 1 n=1 Tax=Durio zibethinus TaxID=66656 RepID=A0A6P6AUR2_DURZI|nr:ubiquitin-fold modifier-conjugating enzyme 1-like isoform X2 [Durio zibethinus]